MLATDHHAPGRPYFKHCLFPDRVDDQLAEMRDDLEDGDFLDLSALWRLDHPEPPKRRRIPVGHLGHRRKRRLSRPTCEEACLGWARYEPSCLRWPGLCARKLQFIEMSLRFRRSIKLLPGVHVNLGLHGAGSQ